MKPKIEVQGLVRAYATPRGRVPVLDGLTFAVADGEFVALVGPSGCGKSTLLGLLAGFGQADAGEVLVDGQRVRGPSRAAMAIFQQPALLPWLDLARNVEFALDGAAPDVRRRLAAHYIDMVGLGGFERMFPRQLSGGTTTPSSTRWGRSCSVLARRIASPSGSRARSRSPARSTSRGG